MERDVIVVGGGIMGVCTAYHLATRGRSVLLLERGALADRPPRSSSADRAKIFRSAYGDDMAMTRLCQRSFRWWRQFEAASGTRLFEQCGMVVYGAGADAARSRWADAGAASWAAVSHRTLVAAGIASVLVGVDELRSRYPVLEPQAGHDVALIDMSARLLYAAAAVRAVGELAAAAGAEIREHAVVSSVHREGEHVTGLVVDDELARAREAVVFAAGAWNPGLVPELRPLIRASRQQIVHFAMAKEAEPRPEDLPIVVDLDERRYLYAIPGGTLAVADDENRDPAKQIDPQGGVPSGADDAFWLEAETFAAAHVPTLGRLARGDGKTCLYSNSATGGYLVYRRANAVVVSACSGHGFKNGPSIGLLAAQLSTREVEGPTVP